MLNGLCKEELARKGSHGLGGGLGGRRPTFDAALADNSLAEDTVAAEGYRRASGALKRVYPRFPRPP